MEHSGKLARNYSNVMQSKFDQSFVFFSRGKGVDTISPDI